MALVSRAQTRDPSFSKARRSWVPALRRVTSCRAASRTRYRAYAAGTGSAVTDLIFSIAKREVTFLSGTELISFL
jgi:hypothetical protein